MLCEFVDFELFPHADPKCTPTPERPCGPFIYARKGKPHWSVAPPSQDDWAVLRPLTTILIESRVNPCRRDRIHHSHDNRRVRMRR